MKMKKSLIIILGIALAIWTIQIVGPISVFATSEETGIETVPAGQEKISQGESEEAAVEENAIVEDTEEGFADEDPPPPAEEESEKDTE